MTAVGHGSFSAVVLTDLKLPEGDGFGVLRAMKDDPQLGRVPVIVLSALDAMERVVRAVELGQCRLRLRVRAEAEHRQPAARAVRRRCRPRPRPRRGGRHLPRARP